MDFKALFAFEVLDRVTEPVRKIRESVGSLKETVNQVNRETQKLSETFKGISNRAKELGEKVKEAVKGFKDTSKEIAELGASVTAPIAGALYAAIDYEKVLVGEFNKVANLGKKELSEFSKYFMELGKEFGMLPQDVARISAGLAQMGIPTNKLKEYTKVVTQMAFAFDMVPEDAGETIGKIASAFGIKENVKEVKELGDAVNYLSNTLGAKASEILQALSNFAGSARAFGMSAKSASALAGALIDMGEGAGEAGTALKSILQSLTPTNKSFRKLLDVAGLTVEQWRELKKEDPSKAIVILLKRLKEFQEVDPEALSALIEDVVGKEHSERLKKLMLNVEKLEQKLKELSQGKHLGSMAKEIESLRQTTAFELQKLKVELANFGIVLGSLLIPPFKELLSAVTSVFTPIATLVQEHKELAGTLMTVIGAIGLSLSVFGMLGWYIGFVASGIGTLITAFGGIVGFIPALSSAFLTVVSVLKALSLAVLTNPVGLIALAIAGAGFIIYKNWNRLKKLFSSLSSLWKRAISAFLWLSPINAVIRAFKGLVNFLKSLNLFEIGKNIIESLKRGILSVVKAPVEAVKNVASSIVAKVKGFFGIRSPSRVFMEIGEFLNLGLLEGFKKSASLLDSIPKALKGLVPNRSKLNLSASTVVQKYVKSAVRERSVVERVSEIPSYTVNVSVNIASISASTPKEVASAIKETTERELMRMLERVLPELERRKRRKT